MSRLLFLIACAAIAAGCQARTLEDTPCPPAGTTLTYESFGEPFFNAYCNGCHGGAQGYSSLTFGSVERIRASRERIFVTAAGDNVSMPPGPDDPPEQDRERLAEWLACGAP